MRRGTRALAMLVCTVATISLTGCQAMLFRLDHRIAIATPASFATVHQPLTIRWSAQDFAAPADGTYAVFVDRDPMPPNETMKYFDPASRTHNIYVVTRTVLTIDHLDQSPGASDVERNHHDVTVVLLDSSGHRIGESAGFTEFTIAT